MSGDELTQDPALPHGGGGPRPSRFWRWLGLAFLSLVLLLLAGVAVLWWQREGIVRGYLERLLADSDLQATYEIEEIGPDRAVLRNVVVGDPARPDLTLDRLQIGLVARFGLPQMEQVRLDKVRIWGRVVDGRVSFGSLDPLIYTDSTEPFRLPDLLLDIRDARGLIEGPQGPVAFKLEGSGALRDGFSADLAAIAPDLLLSGCSASGATLYGRLSVVDEQPRFVGPARFASIACAGQGASLAGGNVQLDLIADRDLGGVEGEFGLRTGAGVMADASLAALSGAGSFAYREGDLTSRYDLTGRAVEVSGLRLASAGAEGTLTAREDFARLEIDSDLSGTGMRVGPTLDERLAGLAAATDGTLAQPLLARFRTSLAQELAGSALAVHVTARSEDGRMGIVIPQARVTGRSGQGLLLVSRAQLALGDQGVPRFTGNFTTGGAGLPRITGRMEQADGGALELRLAMAEYAAGDARLAVPDLRLNQAAGGALTFTGRIAASGALPGGAVRGLEVPINGSLAPSGAVALWPQCTPVRFASLTVAQLAVSGQQVTLCPPSGRSILAWNGQALSLAAGVPALRMTGRLGETPLALSSGAVGLAWPGALVARDLSVTLGASGSATALTIPQLEATLGETIEGRFAGAEASIDAVPLDVTGAEGTLAYAGGVLTLGSMRFTVADRQDPARFYPLLADDARLTLADGRIASDFTLRHPATRSQVARVDLIHVLGHGSGHADLLVDRLTFREDFQPSDLTYSLYGPVSAVEGTIAGRGRVDWTAAGVTASTGRFSSEGLDFAAAFGPVEGASGTIEFTDLLGLTTAPGQVIRVRAINPGIEVDNGELALSLTGGTLLQLERANWPFLGGTIAMQPVELNLGTEEVRRYVIEIRGLEAQRFIDHMDLANISATGMFDGTIPIVFDELGNGTLDGGVLLSRPPGGSVSYIGELTYEDLSPVANFAFDALRALEYERMQIDLNGSLIGELVTSVRFDGVRQGQGAQQNFVTRRLANLPIRFLVNVRAPFYSMMGSLRSLYDPSAVRDPRSLGLLADDGRQFVTPGAPVTPRPPPEPDIQPPESEAMP